MATRRSRTPPAVTQLIEAGKVGHFGLSEDNSTTSETVDFRNAALRFAIEARVANQTVVDLLDRIGARLDATKAQVALAGLLAQHPWIVPVPGTRNPSRLEENLAAADLRHSPEDLDEMNAISSAISVQGARYPDAAEQFIDG